jgi:hypothetical protein
MGLKFQDPHSKVRRNKVLSTGSSSNKCSCIPAESERITRCTAQLTHVHDTVCIVSFGKRFELKKLRDSRLSQCNFPEGVSLLKHVTQVTATVRTVTGTALAGRRISDGSWQDVRCLARQVRCLITLTLFTAVNRLIRLQWHRLHGFSLTMINSLPLSWMLYRDDLSTNFRMNWKWITNELAWIQNVLEGIHHTSRSCLTPSCLMTRASNFYRNLWSVSGLRVFRSELQSKVKDAPSS